MPQTLSYLRPIFHEEQHLRGSWAVYTVFGMFGLVVVFVGGLGWMLPAPIMPAIYILLGLGVVLGALTVSAKLITVVDAAGVHVRYFPFLRKTFALDEIVAWTARTYDPMEYGGWGVRGFRGRYGWAYNVRGNRGVEIEFVNGDRLMLGSQRADELARAIEEAKRDNP